MYRGGAAGGEDGVYRKGRKGRKRGRARGTWLPADRRNRPELDWIGAGLGWTGTGLELDFG